MWLVNKLNLSDAMKRMSLARERIARRNPFFASIIFNARLEEVPTENRPDGTIWTNGSRLFFNPEYVKENDNYIEGDFLECILHTAMQHFSRRRFRNKDKWNVACDLAIRPLVHQYFPQHPDLMKGDGLYPDKAAETIYEILPDLPSNKGLGGGQTNPGGMEEPTDPQEAAEAARQWEHSVANALDKGKKAGNLPQNLERLVNELFEEEKLDWRDAIRDMSRDAKSREARSWSRVNRRRNGQDGMPIMPGYMDDVIYNLLIAFDVSGSINNTQLKSMKTEVASVLDQNIINQATLIAVDTEPKSIIVARTAQDVIDWKPRGGGGTDFTSALKLIHKDYSQSIGLVFLTDMETNSFGKETPFPTVWVNFGHDKTLKAPWGRTTEF